MDFKHQLSVYRAITGSGKLSDDSYLHEGVSDEELARKGIFCSNNSFAQYHSPQGSTGYDLRVPGLPVFLNFDEAASWIDRKKYKNAPAIVEAQIPINNLFGNNKKIRLVRNYWDSAVGYEPSRAEVEEHLANKARLLGESFYKVKMGGN
jgi:hypothetical protein